MSVTIEKWITMVSALLSPALPGDAIEHLETLKPHLRQFPPSAFTPDTARAVVEAKRYGPVPAWDVVAPVLRQAVRDSRPANYGHEVPRIDNERAPTSPEEVSAILGMVADFNRTGCSEPAWMRSINLPDVTLKGEALRLARAANGVHSRTPSAVEARAHGG